MRIVMAIAIGILIFSGIALAGTLTNRQLTHNGLGRNYLEYRPDVLANGALPMVLVLHGGTGSASIAASPTRASGHWRVLADAEGFLVVYPNGIDGNWNDCRQVAFSGTPSSADDVGFLRFVVAEMSARFNVDPQRIYLAGGSNGGLMSMRMLQEASDLFAAAATAIALKANDAQGECREPANPSSLILQYGTADPIMVPTGGSGNLSVELTRAYWINTLGCVGKPSVQDYPDLNPSDGSTLQAERFLDCTQGNSLHIVTANGAGHAAPSILYPEDGRQQNRDIEWTVEAWTILKTRTLGIDRLMASAFE